MSVLVVHTTEGGSLESNAAYLQEKGYEPHWVYDPARDEEVQLLPLSKPGKALLNLRGGVETNNRGGVYQAELVGHAVDVPGYDDAWYSNLAKWLQQKCTLTGTPCVFPCEFLPYPESYGQNRTRLTFEQWLTVEGVVGHSHVPENDHGDPGALDVARLQTSVAATESSETEDDMGLIHYPTLRGGQEGIYDFQYLPANGATEGRYRASVYVTLRQLPATGVAQDVQVYFDGTPVTVNIPGDGRTAAVAVARGGLCSVVASGVTAQAREFWFAE